MRKIHRWGYLYKFSLYYPLKMTPLCCLGFLTFLVPFIVHFFTTVFPTLCPIGHLGLVVIGGYTHMVTVITLHLKQPKASPTFPDIPCDAYWTFILGSGHILYSYSKFLWFSSNDPNVHYLSSSTFETTAFSTLILFSCLGTVEPFMSFLSLTWMNNSNNNKKAREKTKFGFPCVSITLKTVDNAF